MRQYTNVYQNNIKQKENNMSNIRINYLSHEAEILKGTSAELVGWWNVALDYLSIADKNEGFTVKKYSALAGKVAKDYEATTIEQNIGHARWAMAQGWTLTSKGVKDCTGAIVKSMGHLRKTKNPPKQNVKPATKKSAYDDVFSQAKHLSKESRARLVADLLATL